MHGKNKQWNRRQARKARKRRIVEIVPVENGDLGEGWFYQIERWDLSTGGTEFGLRIFHRDAFGVQGPTSWKLYGELDHAQRAIQTRLEELRSSGST